MDRSSAARVARPFGLSLPLPRLGSPRGGSARRGARAGERSRGLPGADALRHATSAGLALVRAHRRLRIALLIALLMAPVLGGGWLMLRRSPFVSVQRVQLSGVHGPEAHEIDAALTAAARHMSTLDVNTGALLAAVAPFRVVREVRAVPRFPHGLRIHVVEQLPVAALTVGAYKTAVAADGVVLGPALLSSSLPAVSGSSEPLTGKHVKGSSLLSALTVLGAAPAPLAHLLARVYIGPKGLTVVMRNGLLAYFGDDSRPHAKWFSLTRVLAYPSVAGASYVDVRLPEHPAAGFPGGVAPATESSSSTGASTSGELTSGAESTISALAENLTKATGVENTATSGRETASGAPATGSSSEQATSTTSSETAAPASEQSSETAVPATERSSETSTTSEG